MSLLASADLPLPAPVCVRRCLPACSAQRLAGWSSGYSYSFVGNRHHTTRRTRSLSLLHFWLSARGLAGDNNDHHGDHDSDNDTLVSLSLSLVLLSYAAFPFTCARTAISLAPLTPLPPSAFAAGTVPTEPNATQTHPAGVCKETLEKAGPPTVQAVHSSGRRTTPTQQPTARYFVVCLSSSSGRDLTHRSLSLPHNPLPPLPRHPFPHTVPPGSHVQHQRTWAAIRGHALPDGPVRHATTTPGRPITAAAATTSTSRPPTGCHRHDASSWCSHSWCIRPRRQCRLCWLPAMVPLTRRRCGETANGADGNVRR